MARGNNTDVNGNIFKSSIVDAVWKKGIKYDNESIKPESLRKDICRDGIAKNDYGKTEKWGWEIDHIKPVSKGGTDDIDNLQPLFWENNRAKSDKFPWKCSDR